MNKKLLALSVVTATSLAFGSVESDVAELKAQVANLQKTLKKVNYRKLKKQIKEVKALAAADNLKLSADLRTSFDVVNYELADGSKQTNNIWSNRLIIGMKAKPLSNLVFLGKMEVNKIFGLNKGGSVVTNPQVDGGNAFSNFDWYSSETPDDNIFRLREAYFVYFGNFGDVSYTASFGRRPAINGLVGNLREDDKASSPLAHIINMEFDGASFKFNLDKTTDIAGMYFKLCLGRGNSNATGKYTNYSNMTKYIKNETDSPNMDLLGFIFRAYDDGQYSVNTNYFKAFNTLGFQMGGDMLTGMPSQSDRSLMGNFTDVGNLTGGAVTFIADGIGDEINDFLDDTTLFASFAFSKTDPRGFANIPQSDGTTMAQPMQMLGSTDSETGTSYYIGTQFPAIITETGRIGLEYNHGSKYWRSFTYGEDTLIGSKVATRGDAYEIYYNQPILGKNLSMQLRYTYIDYDYTGSDGFFGNATGTPMKIKDASGMANMMGMPQPIDKADNFRAYIRYSY